VASSTECTATTLTTCVRVELTADEGEVRLAIRDDGVGGADPAHGSGLLGIRDRVEALGGTMEVISPVNGGTTILVRIPCC
jgi:signal transduction histidine kinase